MNNCKRSTIITSGFLMVLSILLSFPLVAQKPELDKANESEAKDAPKLVFKDLSFDFGEVKKGEKVSHTFIVKNEGSGNLVINNVSPG